MAEIWRYLTAELQALGWRCIALGPEFWMSMAFIALLGIAVIIIFYIWGG